MRRPFLVCATAAYLFCLGATPAGAAGWKPDIHAASGYAATRSGSISFAVRTEHRAWGRDATRSVPSASVLKVMLLVAYLRRPDVRRRALRRADRELLAPMVRWSDNVAASRVFGIVGSAGLVRLAHRVGMERVRPAAPVWGLSSVDAADQTRFLLHVDRPVPRRHRRAALRLLGSIVPSQRWGSARAATRLGALLQGRLGIG